MKNIIAGILVFLFIVGTTTFLQEFSKDNNYASVIKISTYSENATGFVIKYDSQVLGITNYHVCIDAMQEKLEMFAKDIYGNIDSVVPINWSIQKDLCVLKVGNKIKAKPAKIDLDTKINDYTDASVWGYPKSYALIKVSGKIYNGYDVKLYCTKGVCALNSKFQLIHTEILPGNSGSPVFVNNSVVGVVFANDENKHGYVIPNYLLKEFLLQYSTQGVMSYAAR